MAFHYTLPIFNLDVNIWHDEASPPVPPDVVTVGNLAWGRRVNIQGQGSDAGGFGQAMLLMVPKLTDIRWANWSVTGATDRVEVPAGSGRFYLVQFVDDIGKGFANEHRAAVLAQLFGIPPMP